MMSPDVYISDDGGYTWARMLEGPHHYAILDSGGLIVAIAHSSQPVNVLECVGRGAGGPGRGRRGVWGAVGVGEVPGLGGGHGDLVGGGGVEAEVDSEGFWLVSGVGDGIFWVGGLGWAQKLGRLWGGFWVWGSAAHGGGFLGFGLWGWGALGVGMQKGSRRLPCSHCCREVGVGGVHSIS